MSDQANRPPLVSFTSCWGHAGTGRWYKRRLSKLRRGWARMFCRQGDRAYRHMRGLVGWEGEVNWRGW